MKGILVAGTEFRQLRQSRGLTQAELAKLAGVGERTVRNAESGHRVRMDFLRYLAGALGVDVRELVQDIAEVCLVRNEQENAERVSTAMLAYALDRDVGELRSLIDDANFRLFFPGPSKIPFTGEYRGIDGIRRLMDIAEQSMIYDKPPDIAETRSSGNLVILSGVDYIRSLADGQTCGGWWQHIFEFAEGKVVRVDVLADTLAMSSAFED